MRNAYEDYYLQQVGHGLPVFVGARVQRGHGIGNVLGGVFRQAVPLLTKGAKILATRGARAGMKALGDVVTGRKRPREAVKSRLLEAGMDVLKTMVAPAKKKRKAVVSTKRRKRPVYAKRSRDVFDK
jgi:hypothetical protein